MESIGPECTDLKKTYDDCFNRWYAEKFLRGQLDASPCQELFDEYKACLAVGMSGLVCSVMRRLTHVTHELNPSRQ